jgi:uncharacterized Ntn-hydrolase superfamily protein
MTYSIVARDAETGEFGVGAQSHFFSVGSLLPWAEAGVGAVATQAFAQPAFGPLGLALLRAGVAAAHVIPALIATDPDSDRRQVAVVDGQGRVAAHTGARVIPAAGDMQGDGFTVQANMMRDPGVPAAMANAFTDSAGPLAVRLLTALDAAEAAGGDIRGRQSAAVLVVRGTSTGRGWDDVLVDVRVDDHPDPLGELHYLVGLRLAYNRANEAGAAVASGDIDGGLAELAAARAAAPRDANLIFASLLAAAGVGRQAEAEELAAQLRALGPGWHELLRRLPAVGLLPDGDPDFVARLLAE